MKVATKEKKKRKLRTICLGIKDNVNQKLLHNLALTNDDNIKGTL